MCYWVMVVCLCDFLELDPALSPCSFFATLDSLEDSWTEPVIITLLFEFVLSKLSFERWSMEAFDGVLFSPTATPGVFYVC